MKRISSWMFVLVAVLLCASAGSTAQSPAPSADKAWVMLPAAGDTTAQAFAFIDNPTMYGIYLQSATSDATGGVEFRDGTGEDKPLKWISVDAYGSVEMKPKGVYIKLVDLKKPLKEGDTVPITITTDGGAKIAVSAVVRKAAP